VESEPEQSVPPLAAHLAAAADAVRLADASGLPLPQCVTVTAGGVIAQFDTEGLLAWGGVMFSPRPQVTTYPDSPYVLAAGLIEGAPWRAHNGYVPPQGVTAALPAGASS
jgi:hypothetical protein